MFDKNAKPSPQRQRQLDSYKQLVERMSPNSNLFQGIFRAFWVGGTICCFGQFLQEAGKMWLGMNNTAASTFCSTALVFLTALLTGLGVWDKIGQYAGAGAFVPITGFANAVVAPALDNKPEGKILGTGVQMFSIAGPVIVYGVLATNIYGLIYYILKLCKVM